MPLKILFISTARSPVSAEKIRVKYFIKALLRAGYSVLNYEIHYHTIGKYLNYLFHEPPKDLINYSKNSDLVIATNPPLLNAIYAYMVAKHARKPLIIDVRDLWEEYAKIKYSRLIYNTIVKKIVKKYYEALRHATNIIVTTEHMKKHYDNLLGIGYKTIVIPNGTDPDIIKCPNTVKREYDLVYLADFNQPYHALDILLEAIRDPTLKLLIIGEGKYLNKIMRKYNNKNIKLNIKLAGKISYEKLSDYLCRAKIGVVGRPFINNPEYLYTIPVKTYDYLAAELPILAYGPKNSALEEFIKNNSIGEYIGSNTPDSKILYNKLNKLILASEKYRYKTRSLSISYDRKKISTKIVNIINNISPNF